jgi:hypothetical protein
MTQPRGCTIACSWDPSGESDDSKLEQVKYCIDLVLVHCVHWLHLELTHLVQYAS